MTSRDLAKLIGVSQSTISRAFNNAPDISAKRREEIIGIARQYQFELNQNARILRSRKSRTIGVIFPDHFQDFSRNIYLSYLFSSIQKALTKYDFDLVVIHGQGKQTREVIEREIRKRNLAGIVYKEMDPPHELLVFFKELDIPVVILDGNGENGGDFASVYIDTYYGGALVGNHFASSGFTKIAVVDTALVHRRRVVADRSAGFNDSLQKHGLEASCVFHGDFSFESGARVAEGNFSALLQCEALFVHNDAMAFGVMSVLQRKGVSLPGDISLIGFDGIPFAQWVYPRLTTVVAPIDDQAHDAVEWLQKVIEDEECERICAPKRPRLVIGETCL